jgi:Zn-dependent protease
VNAGNLAHPIRDMAWVAVAGPLANFSAAFLTLVIIGELGGDIGRPDGGLLLIVLDGIYKFNLALGIFNLIPLPPLDGGHFLPYLLPRASWSFIHQLEQVGPFLLILLLFTGGTRYVVQPIFNVASAALQTIVRLVL